MARRVAALRAITSVSKPMNHTVPRTAVQRKNTSAPLVSRSGAQLGFIKFWDRPLALQTFYDRTGRLVKQGVPHLEAVHQIWAALDPHLVALIRDADVLTPSQARYDRIKKRTIAQHASNTGQTLTGEKALAWWCEMLAHARSESLVIVAVTVRLSPKIEAKGWTKEQPCDWLRCRANAAIETALGYKPFGIWATGVRSKRGDALHLHGLVAVDPRDVEVAHPKHPSALEIALRPVGGSVDKKFVGRQVKVKHPWSAGALEYLLDNAEEEGSTGRVQGRTLVVTRPGKQMEAPEEVEDKSNLTYHSEETSREVELGVDVCPARTQGVESNNADEGRELADANPDARRDLRQTDRRPRVRRVHASWHARAGRAQRPHDRAWRARQRLPGPDPPAHGARSVSKIDYDARLASAEQELQIRFAEVQEDWPAYVLAHPVDERALAIVRALGHFGAKVRHLRLGEAGHDFEWGAFRAISARPYDLEATLTHQPPTALLATIRRLWTGLDNKNAWALILAILRNSGLSMMDEEEAERFRRLPERVTLYRGFSYRPAEGAEEPMRGFSWSLDRNIALSFSGNTRHGYQPHIAQVVVPRDAIHSLMLHRGHAEAVIDRPDLLANVESESLSADDLATVRRIKLDSITSAETWHQTGSALGSHPGGRFLDWHDAEWYCKFPAAPDQARNEVLAARLYRAAGVAVPDIGLVQRGGQLGTRAAWLDLRPVDPDMGHVKERLAEGFAIDAWLGNWDVVGIASSNLGLDDRGDVVRLDLGGSLEFRARGDQKRLADDVTEIETLRDAGINAHAAAYFAGLSDAQVAHSVARLHRLDDEMIGDLVRRHGPRDSSHSAQLAETLVTRKANLLARYSAERARAA